MAVLTPMQLAELRRETVKNLSPPIDFNKSIINAALQAVEDWYEGEKSTVSGLIDTATSPFAFTNPQKKMMGAAYLIQKSKRETS